jgi:Xaa-Pro aminopeptidase
MIQPDVSRVHARTRDMGIFSDSEMKRRQDAFAITLASLQLDVAILHTADSVFYLSGIPLLSPWGRPMWMVFGPTGTSALVGSKGEKVNNERNARATEVLAFGDEEKSSDGCLRLVCDAVRRFAPDAGRIGLELSLIPFGLYQALRNELPKVDFVEIGDAVGAMRIVKSAEEIELLELGGAVAKIGATAFIEALTLNTTELAVVAHAVGEMDRALGALRPDALSSTFAYCHFGDHSLTPHLHATGRRLRHGDIVALNVFPVICGYLMELERTLIFGTATDAQQKALDAVNTAFHAAKKAVRPGAKSNEIDAVARDILRDRGYMQYVRSGTGHAHGIMIGAAGREELGELRAYNRKALEPNMICSIEPAVYMPELGGGFRHSDVMIVTPGGARCITDFPTQFAFES